jgi:hypothetical protein
MSAALHTRHQTAGAPNLLVLLPGAYMTADDFVSAGFFAAAARRQLALDLVAVDLEVHFRGRPARRAPKLRLPASHAPVWLAAFAGGLLALCHADSLAASMALPAGTVPR